MSKTKLFDLQGTITDLVSRLEEGPSLVDCEELACQLSRAYDRLAEHYRCEAQYEADALQPPPGPNACPICGVETGNGSVCSDCRRCGYTEGADPR